jgi:hypothetical protein
MSKADEPLPVFVVLETFGTEVNGVPTTYVKGDTIDPRHPSVKRWPKLFGPLALTHPVPASVLSFAAKMAEARAAAKAAKEAQSAEEAATAANAAEEQAAAAAAAAKTTLEATAGLVDVQDVAPTPEVKAK